MKININKVNITPKHLPFNLCVFGKLDDELSEWIKYHNFEVQTSDKYTNIILPDNIEFETIFESIKKFNYFDGFSPNLNKHLHLGHLSNLVIAKAIQKLGLTNKTIAILGDTLTGDVNKEEAFNTYKTTLNNFDYTLDNIYYASEQKIINDFMFQDGVDEYEGTKIFDINGDKIVGIKSDGTTSYFYQDVALQLKLNSSTLYLTGYEQNNHFESLKKMFPYIEHKGLGLVMIDGKKMSSSNGNVLYVTDIFNLLKDKLDICCGGKLCYNIIAGTILKYGIETSKNIKLNEIANVKTSMGLYVSYTMARMFSAGIEKQNIGKFTSKKLNYLDFKSKFLIEPNCLFNGLVELCKDINNLYVKHKIKDNEENQKMFQILTNDLILGCEKLGLFIIDEV
jgi:arginyl-tRNA synthetase